MNFTLIRMKKTTIFIFINSHQKTIQSPICVSVLLCLSAYRRTWTNESSSLSAKNLHKMNKTHTSNDVWVLLAQKERLDKALPCLCFAKSYLCVRAPLPVGIPSHMDDRVLVSRIKNKSTHRMGYGFIWRRRRDSNSRTGFPAYALSRGASSPT